MFQDRLKQAIAALFTAFSFWWFYYNNLEGDVAQASIGLVVGIFSFLYTLHLIVEGEERI